MSDKQQDSELAPAPEHCPGTQSKDAGQASACQGCPNQQLCASGAANSDRPDPDVALIARNLSGVKKKVLILSGKGGVGKSTVTSLLARCLASRQRPPSDGDPASGLRRPMLNVGVLDIDICGPSLPRIFGVEGEQVHQSGSGWSPVFVDENLCLMSAGFLLPSLDAAVIWRGPKKNGLIKQLLKDVDWAVSGEGLDILLIDTPPGTSDEHLSIVQYLSGAGLDGAVMVTTPQEVSLLDVRKQMDFCRKVQLPILGIVENMSGYQCANCQSVWHIFPPTSGGAGSLGADLLMGQVPLTSDIGRMCDQGDNLFDGQRAASCSQVSQLADKYEAITDRLLSKLGLNAA